MATVGAGTDSVSLNAETVAIAQTFAANCFRAVALAKYVDGLGQAGLELAGLDSADATTLQQGVDYLKTIAGLIQGTAAQPTDFDFTNALSAFIGPEPTIQP